MLKETFQIDRSYDVIIRGSGEVIFALTHAHIDSWGWEVSSTSLENSSGGRSIAVFRALIKTLNAMVYKYRPPVLWFHIVEPERKPLYKRLVEQFLKAHTAYVSCDDDWEDRLYVVRVKESLA